MGRFNASLKTIGDSKGLPATIEIEEGRLSITAGDADIGNWPLADIGLEPTPSGYRLAAEGDHLLIDMPETELFAEELARSSKKKRLDGLRSGKRAKEVAERPPTAPKAAASPVRVQDPPADTEKRSAAVLGAADVDSAQDTESGGVSGFGRVVATLDSLIATTERRWGSLLPGWVFNRIVFVALALLIGVAFVYRGVTSITLLVAGVVALMIGGAAYTDDVMASKVLPGRATPTHVLVGGVGLLVLGVGFGIIA